VKEFIERWESIQTFNALINEVEEEMETHLRKKKGYWYFKTVYCCVLCGRETVYRERKYTPKPENPGDRQTWYDDACHEHFM